MSLPNFLIIGAAKSGTTALYHYLKQHPEIYMSPQKETNFFAFEGQEVRFEGPGDERTSGSAITTLTDYEKQFDAVDDEKAIGEASPWYLYSPRAAANIRRHLPEAKLIVVLRNPVDRAFSSYLHVVRDGREHLGFAQGLLAEEGRVSNRWEYIWHYQRAGFYAQQVERFLSVFDRDQIRFYLYDDLRRDLDFVLEDVCTFLGVNTDFAFDTSLKPNTTGVPKNRLLGRLLFQPNPIKASARVFVPRRLRYELSQKLGQVLLGKPQLAEQTRNELMYNFEEDISKLQDLIKRDLTFWRAQ